MREAANPTHQLTVFWLLLTLNFFVGYSAHVLAQFNDNFVKCMENARCSIRHYRRNSNIWGNHMSDKRRQAMHIAQLLPENREEALAVLALARELMDWEYDLEPRVHTLRVVPLHDSKPVA